MWDDSSLEDRYARSRELHHVHCACIRSPLRLCAPKLLMFRACRQPQTRAHLHGARRICKNMGMNAIHRYQVPLLALIASAMFVAGCESRSKQQQDLGDDVPPSPSIPLAAVAAADSERKAIVTDAGGIAARYAPEFAANGALVRIDEERTADRTRGSYLFQGARLLRYEGAPLNGSGTLLLELDLQGKTLTARYNDGPASEEQVSAIRARAQLLRNHALAQHAARSHSAQY